MRRSLWHGCFAVLFVLLLTSTSATYATTVKGRSGYGPGPNSPGAEDFTTCANPTGTNSCMVFDLTDVAGTATLDGILSFNIYQFAFNPGGAGGQTLDVINLGALASGTTFTLTSSLFNAANLEVFACDGPNDPNATTTALTLTDSVINPATNMGAVVPGPCTPTPFSDTSLSFDLATGKFTLNQNVSDLVLDFAPTTAATPEPASLALLGVGLAAIGARLRRKAA